MNAIELKGVRKRFGQFAAVDGLDLVVPRGEVYGFLGRNGAGKTTTIRALLGMVGVDEGEITVLGQRVSRGHGPWYGIGSLVESAAAWPDLSARQNLLALADLHGLSPATANRALARLGLESQAEIPARRLSLGNRQRLGLAMAVLPEPELLVLDEPVNGLDPLGVIAVRELLEEHASAGGTVFVSSHLLDEVARTCTRIGILHQGRLVDEFDRAEAEARLERRLVVEGADVERARSALVAAGIPESSLHWENRGLEELFLRKTAGSE